MNGNFVELKECEITEANTLLKEKNSKWGLITVVTPHPSAKIKKKSKNTGIVYVCGRVRG